MLSHVESTSPFFQQCGRITLAGDLIGSVLNGASTVCSSVVMAYWPGRGDNVFNIDYSRMRVGVVQYFFKHSVVLYNGQTSTKHRMEHFFACIYWKERHPREDWFGISATVCVNMFEPLSTCNFVPVQRIASKCAHCVLDVDFCGTKETVFVACPIPIKYCL